jgi:hypothetical protein
MQKLAGVTLLVVICKIYNKIILEQIKNSLHSVTIGHVLIRSIH